MIHFDNPFIRVVPHLLSLRRLLCIFQDPMDVDDMTPLLKSMSELIRPKAEDMPDAVRRDNEKERR